jgi:hypothetical protein
LIILVDRQRMYACHQMPIAHTLTQPLILDAEIQWFTIRLQGMVLIRNLKLSFSLYLYAS